MLRLWAFLAMSAAFIGVYQIGSLSDVGQAESDEFMEEFSKLIDGIDAVGIFVHNSLITLVMFIPGVGVAWGFFSAWSTGYAFAAIVTSAPNLGIPAVAVFLTPFGLMELGAYSLAMSRSALIAYSLARTRELGTTYRVIAAELGVVFALLLVGAFVEYAMLGMIDAQQYI